MLCAWAVAAGSPAGLGQPQRLGAQPQRLGVVAAAAGHQAAVEPRSGRPRRRAAAPPGSGSSASSHSLRRSCTDPACARARQSVRVGERGRRLVGRQRRPVLAAQGVHVAERLVQAPGLGVPERERGAVVIERLGGGRQLAGAVARLQVGVGRRRRLAASSRWRAISAGSPRPQRQHLGHPAVQQPPARQSRPLLDQSAQALVGEVVLGIALDDQPARLELLQCRSPPRRRSGRWSRAPSRRRTCGRSPRRRPRAPARQSRTRRRAGR